MAITYFEISYPNFVLGAIIDPEEANQNNHEIVDKVNDIIEANNINEVNITNLGTVKADVIDVDNKFNINSTSILEHKTSIDHDYKYYTKTLLDGGQLDNRYYTETEINSKVSTLATKNDLLLKADKLNVYTKEELTPWLRGGDTNIREEVFTILSSNNGDGTFTYSSNGSSVIGMLDEEGFQIFRLTKGYYEPSTNRIEAFVNDTLRRSVSSGGLKEIDNYNIALSPEGSGAEVTVKYYERVGMTAEYTIKMGATKPPSNNGKNMWFKVIG